MKRVRKSSKRDKTCKDAGLSTNSEEDEVGMKTRSSFGKRQWNQKDLKASSSEDFVYDADDDTATSDSPSGLQTSDPYEFDFTEDVPVKIKGKKTANKANYRKEAKKSKTVKKTKGTKKMNSNSTSTPVLVGHMSEKTHLKKSTSTNTLVTPEVTPILPVHNENKTKECSDDSFNTPTVRRSVRKRSLRLEGSTFSSFGSSKSFSSQADSGIVVSPPEKKKKSPDSFQLDPPLKNIRSCTPISTDENQGSVSKQGPTISSNPDCKREKKRKALAHKMENDALKKYKKDDSCFGFDSLPFLSVSDENLPEKRTKKMAKTSKPSYRSKKASGSSPDSPLKDSSEAADQENNHMLTRSPVLFSDDFFSDDAVDHVPRVNKTSSQSYTSLKAKTQRSQKLISKLDSWANEYNSRFEDIEKFELVIE